MNIRSLAFVFIIVCFTGFLASDWALANGHAQEKIKVLIVDGQNNHKNWIQTTEMMESYLLDSGRFEVKVARTKDSGTDADFAPDFAEYDVVLSNYNGAPWPKTTQENFVKFVAEGGGFVVVHAADNSFPGWKEYNEIIGLGGWGGRNEKSGPYVYFRDDEKIVDKTAGPGGGHGPQHPFQIIVRDDEHPIMKDIPSAWMHVNDELYHQLRGPAANMNILATAYSDKSKRGTERHEPMVMTIAYEKGRVFHTPMGHGNDSQQCVGFMTMLLRGTEWAATGEVTIDVPDDFPTVDETSSRKFEFENDK